VYAAEYVAAGDAVPDIMELDQRGHAVSVHDTGRPVRSCFQEESAMPDDSALRKHLIDLLEGSNAHIPFSDAVNGFPVERAGVRPGACPHSAWELLEHLRIAQYDILAFSGGTKEPYVELKWPDDYWPDSPDPANAKEWTKSVETFQRDLQAFAALLRDTRRDLYEPFPWGQGQTLLREALLIADHNAYHVGQLMLVRRMLGTGAKA
jgi:hypothetical protein